MVSIEIDVLIVEMFEQKILTELIGEENKTPM